MTTAFLGTVARRALIDARHAAVTYGRGRGMIYGRDLLKADPETSVSPASQ